MNQYKQIASLVINSLKGKEFISSEKEFTNSEDIKLIINDYNIRLSYNYIDSQGDIYSSIIDKPYTIKEEGEKISINFQEVNVKSRVDSQSIKTEGLTIEVFPSLNETEMTEIRLSTIDKSNILEPNEIAISCLCRSVDDLIDQIHEYPQISNNSKVDVIDPYYQELSDKLKKNNEIIKGLQIQRDYYHLIKHYKENTELNDLLYANGENLPLIAYCQIRLNKFDEAKQTMKEYRSLYPEVSDPDGAHMAFVLIGLFLQNENNAYLLEMIKNTLESWLNDPESEDQIKNIVFDYEDYF